MILDGWGLAPKSLGNPIAQANLPNYKKLIDAFPNGQLLASGEAVGLFNNDPGNTEVGHLNIAAGRVVKSPVVEITESIKNGSFFNNSALRNTVSHVKTYNSNLHIMGLFSSGHVHSSNDYLYALIEFAKRAHIPKLFIHLFTDGRDSSPTAALPLLKQLEVYIKRQGLGAIATIIGRFYAMDRVKLWSRTQKAFDALFLGIGEPFTSPTEAIKSWYKKNITDEFIPPSVIVGDDKQPLGKIKQNDAVIFLNHRVDRALQLSQIITDRANKSRNIFLVTLIEYDKHLPVQGVAFPPQLLSNTIGEVLSSNKLRQLRIAETEKERFVTYYFNGFKEEPFTNEDRIIVPSPQIETYDQRPEMSAYELTKQLLSKMKSKLYDFIVVNYANPDMVGHTGLFKATIKACEAVDNCLGKIADEIFANEDGLLIITADHGNAEEKIDLKTGLVLTEHTNNPVPLIFVGNKLKSIKLRQAGVLSDIAPTVLSLLNLPIPKEMTGKNLLI